MNTLADKIQNTKSKSETNEVSHMQRGDESIFQFVDNRPENIAQRKRQDLANNSSQAKQSAQLQAMADNYSTQQQQSIKKKENKTGLPDKLKAGVESLSGYAMDDVKVHYNSDKPSQLQAHAYAQGADIHLASGQEAHLPHETWHVVQQKQGVVKSTMQMTGGVNVNDDMGLEKEADLMGAKALKKEEVHSLNNKINAPSLHAKKLLNGNTPVQRMPKLVKVIWGVTHLVREMGESIFGKGDLEQEEFGKEGELKEGQNLIIDNEDIFISRRGANQEDSLRRKQDEVSTPNKPWYRVLIVNFKNVENENLYVRAETVAIEDRPGTKMIELGAGPMDSARSAWMNQSDSAFTEFRSLTKLEEDYGEGYTSNIHQILEQDPFNNQNNAVVGGIDATQEGPFENLPLTENLRFTNPNIGHQDIQNDMTRIINDASVTKSTGTYDYPSMGMVYTLNFSLINKYMELGGKGKKLETIINSTANSISTCRNLCMLHSFMLNGPEKLIPDSGYLEIIVSESYLERWPLESMANDMGYNVVVGKNYNLGFENIKTQESEKVSSKKEPKKVKLILRPPWGGSMLITDVLVYCNGMAKWTERQPSLLTLVKKP